MFFMKYYLITILSLSIFLASCGKKEDVQTSMKQQQPQQTQQTNTTGQPQQTTQQTTQQTPANLTKDPKDVKKTDDNASDKQKTEINKQDPKPVSMDPLSGNVIKKSKDDIDFSIIFSKKCAKCHGRDGHGKSDGAPNLTADSTRSKSDSKLFQILSNGVKNPDPDGDDMPAWKGKLTEDEINAGIKYIRNLP